MAVTHPLAVRNALADLVVDQLDINSPPGALVLLTAGGAEVATLIFNNPAFGYAAGGTATANAITDDPSATGGIIAKGELRNGLGNILVMFSVTATGGGGDLELNSVNVAAGQTVRISALTYSAPP